MNSLALTTRLREGAYEGEARLLVYDSVVLPGSSISEDIREVLDRRPNTLRIYLLAPFLPVAEVISALTNGTALRRAGATSAVPHGEVSVIGAKVDKDGNVHVYSQAYSLSLSGVAVPGKEISLPDVLREGWLFDLFDTSRALVAAPVGVHFGKASGTHTEKFLRASSVLISTASCAFIAYFAVAKVGSAQPRRIFVDTAPLLSLAFAIQRAAAALNVWVQMPPAKSFSSYGGMDNLPILGRGDLILISASTSGGLARKLVQRGAPADSLVTLFLLRSDDNTTTPGQVLCDLTYVPSHTFGYPPLTNHPAERCSLCERGFLLAELEGDQFLLERRAVKRLRISIASQTPDARDSLERISRQHALKVRLYRSDLACTEMGLDVDALLLPDSTIARAFHRLLIRFAPTPLNYVVLVGMSKKTFSRLAEESGITGIVDNEKVIGIEGIDGLDPIERGNALVVVDYLADHAAIRGLNAQLRSKVPGGCVAYLACVTVAESARNLADLRIFLSYGEDGPETFIYRSTMDLMLPRASDHASSWDVELQLLRRIAAEERLAEPLLARKSWLEGTSIAQDHLFLQGRKGDLRIARDFVFLDTKHDISSITQADVYSVICNLLATARCGDKGIREPTQRGIPTLKWEQTVYGQVVLCPSNFRDYNDAVLHASLLRAADPQELNYTVDDQCSQEMLDILLAHVVSWRHGRGDALPEFVLSMGCGRLRLQRHHLESFRANISRADLPDHIKLLVDQIESG